MGQMSQTYIHGHHDSVLRSHRWRTVENSAAYLVSSLAPGDTLADVGCGPGTITFGLAERVARVVGIDAAAGVLAEARSEAQRQGHQNVSFEVGDVYALGFADGEFDVVHAHQVLQHLVDPVAALREMARVCRPGGIVAVRDGDYAGMSWYPLEPVLEEWMALYHAIARANQVEADGGRHLPRWCREAGLAEMSITVGTYCYAGAAETRWWGDVWAERATRSRFAEEALGRCLATPEDLARIADGWRAWACHPDALFVIPNVEVLCRR